MKIVLAPDKFKSCMTSPEVCRIMREAFLAEIPGAEIVSLPMADGGDGTARAMAAATGGRIENVCVTGPLGGKVEAEYAYSEADRSGVVEMASASGIALVPREKLNPLKATTRGTGEVLRALLDRGAKSITVGLGGSATVDGGTGMARALGFRFLDGDGNELEDAPETLARLASIDVSHADPRLRQVKIQVACDVTSPLLGPAGAAHVFGPQKGASPVMVEQLEAGLARLAEVWIGQGLLDAVDRPGDGAAGGLGAGLRAFCGAEPRSGARLVMETLHFYDHLQGADLVVTGEGCTDAQTTDGKLCSEVARAAHDRGIPVLLLSGALRGDLTEFNRFFDMVFSISSGHADLDSALSGGPEDLRFCCRNLARVMRKEWQK